MATWSLGEPVRATLPRSVPYQLAFHAMLIHLWTRKADRFVATALELTRGRTVPGHVAQAIEGCALLVMRLDGVGASWEAPRAAKEIRTTAPALLFLVGKETSSHYEMRRREFDELQEMAQYIGMWVLDGGPPTSLYRA